RVRNPQQHEGLRCLAVAPPTPWNSRVVTVPARTLRAGCARRYTAAKCPRIRAMRALFLLMLALVTPARAADDEHVPTPHELAVNARGTLDVDPVLAAFFARRAYD